MNSGCKPPYVCKTHGNIQLSAKLALIGNFSTCCEHVKNFHPKLTHGISVITPFRERRYNEWEDFPRKSKLPA